MTPLGAPGTLRSSSHVTPHSRMGDSSCYPSFQRRKLRFREMRSHSESAVRTEVHFSFPSTHSVSK